MTGDGIGERVREVARRRADVLAALAADPRGKPALVDALDISRSTVDRAVDELVETDLVAADGSVYTATKQGELVLEARRSYVEETDAIAAAVPLIEAQPADAPFETTLLTGGEVRLAEPHAPESVLTETAETLREAEAVYGFAPVIKSSYASLLYSEVVERDLEVEIIIERAAKESLAEVAAERSELGNLLAAERVTILETEADLPYALWYTSGEDAKSAGVTVHDAGGIVGVVTSDDPEAVAWCRDQYQSVRTDADVLDFE